MLTFCLVVVVLLVIFFVIVICMAKNDAEKVKRARAAKSSFFDEKGWKRADFIWFGQKTNIEKGFNVTENELICVTVTRRVIKGEEKFSFSTKIIPTSEIVEVSIIENDNVVQSYKTNGSVVGRGLVGATLFGAAGAVIGAGSALSDKTITSKRFVDNIKLSIVSNNLQDHLNIFSMYEGRVDASSKDYSSLKDKITSLAAKIKVASKLFEVA